MTNVEHAPSAAETAQEISDNWVCDTCHSSAHHSKMICLRAEHPALGEGTPMFYCVDCVPTPSISTLFAPVIGARYTHKKRGGVYTVVALPTGQCSGNDRIEGKKFVCYRNDAGKDFVRPWREFRDGRFVLLPATAAQDA